MTRGLSAGNLAAIAQPHIRPIVFVRLEFDGGTVYTHNAVGTFTWGSQTWTGIGALGDIGPIEEGIELSPYGVTLQCNALDTTFLSTAVDEEVFNRRSTIYIGFLDENGVLVADPQERWSGYMDNISVSLGDGADGLALQCENEFRFFDRANGALFTDEDQQRRYPGDVGFEFQDQLIDSLSTMSWGGVTSRLGTPGRPRSPGTQPGTKPPGNGPLR